MGINVAFSWPWNTGKTTLIKEIKELFADKDVLVLEETAREELLNVWTSDIWKLQQRIQLRERERAEYIKWLNKETYDLLLIDRTWIDQLAYLFFNMINKKITSPVEQVDMWDIYDLIIVLDTPIKNTWTEWLQHYNDWMVSDLMSSAVKWRFWDKAILFSNAKEDWEKIKQLLQKLI